MVTVVDENRVGVPSARVTLTQAGAGAVAKAETDYAGRCEFANLAASVYQVRVEKEGFYSVHKDGVQLGETRNLEITLPHQQEYHEALTVKYSPPAIDPAQVTLTDGLDSREIIHLPYATTRDIRNAFPLVPGVLPDRTGQVHLNGSASRQILNRLDEFDISQPVTGLLDLRVSADAVRSIDVQGSRTSAEFGKGSGGVLNLQTGMGDDHYRFSATDFIPSLQNRKGIHIEALTPRATISGPLRRGKAWFYDAADGEYDLTIFKELPEGADQAPRWRWSNLAKAQVNLTSGNLLTTSFLVNQFRSSHSGLSPVSPLETTVDLRQSAYLATVKDQAYLARGMLLEAGFAFSHYTTEFRPRGDLPYVIRPEGTSGNFFETSDGSARRWQAIANLYLPVVQWHGRHEFKIGTDFDRITSDQSVQRGEIFIFRENGTLDRQASFSSNPRFGKNNFEVSGFVQDRWSVIDRWLLESGLRLDWDEILERPLVSPRLASTYLLTADGNTKLSLGIGLVYDETNLVFLRRRLAGQRMDLFFAADGITPLGSPVVTRFLVNEPELTEPRSLNWSMGLERKLPAAVYLKVEYLQKRGMDGFDFQNEGAGPAPGLPSGLFVLRNDRRDHYDAVTLTVRHTFKESYQLFGSYTRSAARSNAALDSNLEFPLFSPQASGRLDWDAPNRLLSWGWLPLVKKFDLAYTLDWRTGYPFNVLNQDQELVGRPNSLRFPDFFSLNLHVERRFRLFGFQWALRGGFNNITGRANPTVVNNNVDSPFFLTFSGESGRSFTGRIRFLGRK